MFQSNTKKDRTLPLVAGVLVLSALFGGCENPRETREKLAKKNVQRLGDEAVELILEALAKDDLEIRTCALKAIQYLTPPRRSQVWKEGHQKIVDSLNQSETVAAALAALAEIDGAAAEHVDAILAKTPSLEGEALSWKDNVRLTAACRALGAARSDKGIDVLVGVIREFNANHQTRTSGSKSKPCVVKESAAAALEGLVKIGSARALEKWDEVCSEFAPFPRPYSAAARALSELEREKDFVRYTGEVLTRMQSLSESFALLDQAHHRLVALDRVMYPGNTVIVNRNDPRYKKASLEAERVRTSCLANFRRRHAALWERYNKEAPPPRGGQRRPLTVYKLWEMHNREIVTCERTLEDLFQGLEWVDDDNACPLLFGGLSVYGSSINTQAVALLAKRLGAAKLAGRFFDYLTARASYSMREIKIYTDCLSRHCATAPASVAAALLGQVKAADGDPAKVSWVKKIIAIDVLATIGTRTEIAALEVLAKDKSTFKLTTTTTYTNPYRTTSSTKDVSIAQRALEAVARIRKRG